MGLSVGLCASYSGSTALRNSISVFVRNAKDGVGFVSCTGALLAPVSKASFAALAASRQDVLEAPALEDPAPV